MKISIKLLVFQEQMMIEKIQVLQQQQQQMQKDLAVMLRLLQLSTFIPLNDKSVSCAEAVCELLFLLSLPRQKLRHF